MAIVNNVASFIIFAFCVWAVLDLRVHTRFIGTLILSVVGMAAMLNILSPEFAGMLPRHYGTFLNVMIAGAAIWFRVHWRDPRRCDRENIL